MSKKLCCWDRGEINQKIDKYKQLVSEGRYVCTRCGRVAAEKERLCKPEPLKG